MKRLLLALVLSLSCTLWAGPLLHVGARLGVLPLLDCAAAAGTNLDWTTGASWTAGCVGAGGIPAATDNVVVGGSSSVVCNDPGCVAQTVVVSSTAAVGVEITSGNTLSAGVSIATSLPWQAAHNYSVGDIVYPTGSSNTTGAANRNLFKVTSCSGSCTSGGSEPTTWNQTPGGTLVDNTGANQVTWTNTSPLDIRTNAKVLVDFGADLVAGNQADTPWNALSVYGTNAQLENGGLFEQQGRAVLGNHGVISVDCGGVYAAMPPATATGTYLVRIIDTGSAVPAFVLNCPSFALPNLTNFVSAGGVAGGPAMVTSLGPGAGSVGNITISSFSGGNAYRIDNHGGIIMNCGSSVTACEPGASSMTFDGSWLIAGPGLMGFKPQATTDTDHNTLNLSAGSVRYPSTGSASYWLQIAGNSQNGGVRTIDSVDTYQASPNVAQLGFSGTAASNVGFIVKNSFLSGAPVFATGSSSGCTTCSLLDNIYSSLQTVYPTIVGSSNLPDGVVSGGGIFTANCTNCYGMFLSGAAGHPLVVSNMTIDCGTADSWPGHGNYLEGAFVTGNTIVFRNNNLIDGCRNWLRTGSVSSTGFAAYGNIIVLHNNRINDRGCGYGPGCTTQWGSGFYSGLDFEGTGIVANAYGPMAENMGDNVAAMISLAGANQNPASWQPTKMIGPCTVDSGTAITLASSTWTVPIVSGTCDNLDTTYPIYLADFTVAKFLSGQAAFLTAVNSTAGHVTSVTFAASNLQVNLFPVPTGSYSVFDSGHLYAGAMLDRNQYNGSPYYVEVGFQKNSWLSHIGRAGMAYPALNQNGSFPGTNSQLMHLGGGSGGQSVTGSSGATVNVASTGNTAVGDWGSCSGDGWATVAPVTAVVVNTSITFGLNSNGGTGLTGCTTSKLVAVFSNPWLCPNNVGCTYGAVDGLDYSSIWQDPAWSADALGTSSTSTKTWDAMLAGGSGSITHAHDQMLTQNGWDKDGNWIDPAHRDTRYVIRHWETYLNTLYTQHGPCGSADDGTEYGQQGHCFNAGVVF